MSASERRWLIGAVVLVTLLTSAPYLIGWAASEPERPFSGVLMLPGDMYSYFAKMRLGAGGAWLYHNVYAVEPHPATPLYLFYLLLGHAAALGSEGARVPLARLVMIYHAARAVFGAVLLVMLYPAISLLLNDPRQRRLAWALIALGGGLGWVMLIVFREPLPLGNLPLDLYLGEAVTAISLLIQPHALMARSALLGGLLCLTRADESGSERWALAAGGCWLLATMGVPFDILIAGGIVGGWLAARWALTRRFPGRLALLGLLAGAPGMVFDLITLAVISGNPVYAAWNAQNSLPLPHPLHLISLYGLQLALSVAGVTAVIRARLRRADLFTGWWAAGLLLPLIPLPFQLRLVESYSVPLITLAVAGLSHLTRNWGATRQRIARVALLMLLLPSTLFLFLGSISQLLFNMDAVSYTRDQVAMLGWLRQNVPPGSVMLSSDGTGLLTAAAAPITAVVGHGFETPDFERKQAEARRFYGGEMSDEEQVALLTRYGVRYVWYGPAERALACENAECIADPFDPSGLPLRLAASSGPYALYEVIGP